MTFVSAEFLVFFAVVYAGFLLVRDHVPIRNLFLVVASYVFYAWGSWQLALLLFGSTLFAYLAGLLIAGASSQSMEKFWLTVGVAGELLILGYFKYVDFMIDAFVKLISAFGLQANITSLNILLPIGISFYTFQGIAYIVDVYRDKSDLERNFVTFSLYKAYFPQLVAGPIERASHMLPQFRQRTPLTVDDLWKAMLFLIIGYFQKILIADTMAGYVDHAFQHPYSPWASGATCLLAIFAFGLQIYCDFAGYSLIARGLAKLMGFDLMQNFRRPYLATSPRDFWTRWHISLSGWLRDYLYIPLGGSRGSLARTNTNLLTTMMLGGLWHGASWNFVIWGAYHGVLLSIEHTLRKLAVVPPRWWTAPLAIASTAILVHIGWLFFRVGSLDQLGAIVRNIVWNFSPDFTAGYLLLAIITAYAAIATLDYLITRVDNEAGDKRFYVIATAPFVLVLILAHFHQPIPFIYFRF